MRYSLRDQVQVQLGLDRTALGLTVETRWPIFALIIYSHQSDSSQEIFHSCYRRGSIRLPVFRHHPDSVNPIKGYRAKETASLDCQRTGGIMRWIQPSTVNPGKETTSQLLDRPPSRRCKRKLLRRMVSANPSVTDCNSRGGCSSLPVSQEAHNR